MLPQEREGGCGVISIPIIEGQGDYRPEATATSQPSGQIREGDYLIPVPQGA